MDINGKILIVEDDALLAMLLEDMLSELSYEVSGTAARLHEALTLASELVFDAAILDVSLAGESSLQPGSATGSVLCHTGIAHKS